MFHALWDSKFVFYSSTADLGSKSGLLLINCATTIFSKSKQNEEYKNNCYLRSILTWVHQFNFTQMELLYSKQICCLFLEY